MKRDDSFCELFNHAYYSFLPVSHMVWRQTEDMVTLYWDSLDSQVDRVDRMMEMQERMIKEVQEHPAFRLPVSGKLMRSFMDHKMVLNCRFSQVLCFTLDIFNGREAGK